MFLFSFEIPAIAIEIPCSKIEKVAISKFLVPNVITLSIGYTTFPLLMLCSISVTVFQTLNPLRGNST